MVVYCGDDLEIAFKELTPAKVKPYATTHPRLLVTVRNNDDALTAQFARTVLFPDAFVQFLHKRPSKRKFPRILGITGREALSADLGGRRSGVYACLVSQNVRAACVSARPIKLRFASSTNLSSHSMQLEAAKVRARQYRKAGPRPRMHPAF